MTDREAFWIGAAVGFVVLAPLTARYWLRGLDELWRAGEAIADRWGR